MHERDIRQAPAQFVTAIRQFTSLMSDELALARAEMKSNISRAGTGIVFFGVAALFALVALNVLASALVAGLGESGLSIWAAALIVGGIFLGTAVIFALVGKSRLDASTLTPDRTLKNVQKDLEKLKEASHV